MGKSLIGGITLLFVALMWWAIDASIKESRRWRAWAAEHHCKVTQRMEGDVLSTVGMSGRGDVVVGTTSTPNKTAYLCDDGVTYWRSE